jgi:hypothetical protein
MKQKAKKVIEVSVIVFLIFMIIASGSLFFYQYAYAGKIYRNVYAANIDLSGKNKTQATVILDKKYSEIANQEVTLKSDSGAAVKTKVSDTGLVLDSEKMASEAYQVGRDNNFVKQLAFSVKTLWNRKNISAESKVNQEAYDNFVKIAVSQLNTDPQDAKLTIENGQVQAVPEKSGIVVNTSNLMDQIFAILSSQNAGAVITLKTNQIVPKVMAADFTGAKQFADSLLAKQIVLTYNGKTFSPSKSQVGNWITFGNDDSGKPTASLNQGNFIAYIGTIAKNIEVQKVDQKVNSIDGSIMQQGVTGIYIDKTDAFTQLKNQLNSTSINIAFKTYTTDPNVIQVDPNAGIVLGLFQGKYLDVNLSKQQLCEIDTNTIIQCYIVSTGKASTPTPVGVRTIIGKNPREWSNAASLWMPWWNDLEEGYGIHELPEWPNGTKEGESHLGTPVSHGCIRLGVGPAEEVYNWAPIGTQVNIHAN